MYSPNSKETQLIARLTTTGIEVDICPETGGIWLDKGEFILLSKKRHLTEQLYGKYYTYHNSQGHPSPRTGEAMRCCSFKDIAQFEECPTTGGLWFDKEEWDKVLKWSPLLDYQLIEETSNPSSQSEKSLPNLWWQTAKMVVLLNGFFVLSCFGISSLMEMETNWGGFLFISLLVSLFSYLVSPWIIDASLFYLYKSKENALDELPLSLQNFIEEIARKNNIKHPRISLIYDGAPQAFTYGHTPNNARIVISTGLMKILGPKELEAVIAHEVGHAVHWDIAFMSWAQLYPTLFYHLFRSTLPSNGERDAKAGGISAFAYFLYVASEYLTLALSRIRELHADRFAAHTQGNPALLSSALVKIGYGLVHGFSDVPSPHKHHSKKQFEALNIMGVHSTGSLMMPPKAKDTPHDPESLKQVMKWDMWNPWSRWYELQSTHPLISRRLNYLAQQSKSLGQKPYVDFDLKQPESYWDEFAIDLSIHLLPMLALIGLPISQIIFHFFHLLVGTHMESWQVILTAIDLKEAVHVPLAFAGLGFGLMVRTYFQYPLKHFCEMSIAALLKKVKVSAVRPTPCTIRGKIIGKGNPGSFFSDDFYIQDETGLIYLDHRSPLSIWEFFFGFVMTPRYIGQEVEVTGWYRRAPVPYIEVKSLRCLDDSQPMVTTYVWAWSFFASACILAASAYFWTVG
ncbi:membrane hypothetical protein [Candidatus Terasakiella magnetica]|uniref:Peptidase M48 domain-containing protein n=1 Tax=Candidatus Terasakiella magnetica TaxID=1867952 RepID=A0A1C3RI84_9PROT|nr:M48 family metalloprotease [Candidatus Terasakiella magnetica]SCA56962.1 membrane hypothetical protein [Candidatus Terasakiella magnetica]